MEKLHYRFTKKEDAKKIHEYSQIVFLEAQHFLLLPEVVLNDVKGQDTEYLEKLLSNKGFIGIVALSENKIVGFCDGWISKKNPLKASIGVSVHEDFRQKGIATKLIQKMLEECKRRQIKFIHLQTFSHNKKAIALYKKLDFTFLKQETPSFVEDDEGKKVEKIYMQKNLRKEEEKTS